MVTRRSVVFLLSDFQTGEFAKALGVSSRRHDLVALPVTDPVEEELPDLGRVVLEDAETGEQIEVNTSSARARTAHKRAAERRRVELEQRLRRARVDTVPLHTNQDYLPELAAFFRRRERRIALR